MSRTVTIEKTLYSFSELSKQAKERARSDYAASLHDWWDATYDDAKAALAFAGFEIDDISFSGFWSQGDGACFKGTWNAKNVSLRGMKDYAPKDIELHRIAREMRDIAKRFPKARVEIVRGSSNYCHEFTPDYEFDLDYYDETRHTNAERAEFERQFIDLARAAMKWIYRQLEQDYEWQISDESIQEMSEANEWEYEVDGSLA